MADCDNIPTLKTVQDFNKDAKVLTEVVTSVQDQTSSKASDGENKITLSGIEKIALGKSRESAPVAFIDGVFEYEFPGFNASLSSFIVRSPNGVFPTQPLTKVVNGVGDYEYDNITTQTIRLKSSWEGGEIIARSLDPTGVGVVQSGISFTQTELVNAIGLNVGDTVFVTDLGNAKFVIRDASYVELVGDKVLNNGLKAELQQLDVGGFSAQAFGVFDDPTDTVEQTTFLDNAAKRCQLEGVSGSTNRVPPVHVPNFSIRSSSIIPTKATWILGPATSMTGYGGVAPTGEKDLTTFANGQIIRTEGIDQAKSFTVGDPTAFIQKQTGLGLAGQLTGLARVSGAGVVGAAATSQGGNFGVEGIVYIDNDSSGWSGYFESFIVDGATGGGFLESAAYTQNVAAASALTPNVKPSGGQSICASFWGSAGLGSRRQDSNLARTASACLAIVPVSASFDKGIIVFDDGLVNKSEFKEFASLTSNCAQVWYPTPSFSQDSGDWIGYDKMIDNGASGDGLKVTKVRRFNSPGSIQREITYLTDADGFSPTDALVNNGQASRRWLNGYFVNSPTVSSDETLKQQRSELTQDELNATLEIAKLPRMFKWISEIAQKGDSAYLHCSPMAQSVWTALENNNLDPTKYGFISNQDGNWSLQPQELLWMICAAQQQKIDDFDSRLAALENKNG